jgi:hypothetical protein
VKSGGVFLLSITGVENGVQFCVMKRLLSLAGYTQLGPVERPPPDLVTMRYINGNRLVDVKVDNSGMVAALEHGGRGYDDKS